METTIAYCGLDCGGCPIHLATLKQDKSKQYAMRESIAKILSDNYGVHSQPEEIGDCDGCRSVSRVIYSGCLKCGIRECAIGKKLESCAFCNDYCCDKLINLFKLDPPAKTRLEEIRKGQGN